MLRTLIQEPQHQQLPVPGLLRRQQRGMARLPSPNESRDRPVALNAGPADAPETFPPCCGNREFRLLWVQRIDSALLLCFLVAAFGVGPPQPSFRALANIGMQSQNREVAKT